MGTYGRFLARPSTADLLRRMGADFRRIDAIERLLSLEDVPQVDQRVEPRLGGAEVGSGAGQLAERLYHGSVQV